MAAICVNCYPGSNVSKLCLQLASLVMKRSLRTCEQQSLRTCEQQSLDHMHTIPHIYNHPQFTSIQAAMDYLQQYGYERCRSVAIHVAFYCDGIGGKRYIDVYDYRDRYDSSQLHFIKPGQIRCLMYWTYSSHTSLFPEIQQKARQMLEAGHEIFWRTLDYDMYLKKYRKAFDEKVLELCAKYDWIDVPDLTCPLSEDAFGQYQYILNLNFKTISEEHIRLTFDQFHYILHYFPPNTFQTRVQQIMQTEYPNGVQMDYTMFMELCQLQPELLDDIELPADNDMDLTPIQTIFNEFHHIYPNSSLQGTFYHTNLMINRNMFLDDYDDCVKAFVDDDDFTCGLDNYLEIFDCYSRHVGKVFTQIYPIISQLVKSYVSELPSDVLAFRQTLSKLFDADMFQHESIRLAYRVYAKMCVYNVVCMRSTPGATHQVQLHTKVVGMWNKVIPPYTSINYTNVQETFNEDAVYSIMHFTDHNVVPYSDQPMYYYLCPSYQDYTRSAHPMTKQHTLSLYSLFDCLTYKYVSLNVGRYFHKPDSIVKFRYPDHDANRFVCSRPRRHVKIDDIINVNEWNRMLSNEVYGIYH